MDVHIDTTQPYWPPLGARDHTYEAQIVIETKNDYFSHLCLLYIFCINSCFEVELEVSVAEIVDYWLSTVANPWPLLHSKFTKGTPQFLFGCPWYEKWKRRHGIWGRLFCNVITKADASAVCAIHSQSLLSVTELIRIILYINLDVYVALLIILWKITNAILEYTSHTHSF